MSKRSAKFQRAIDFIRAELERVARRGSDHFFVKETEVFHDGDAINHQVLKDALIFFQTKEVVRYAPSTQAMLDSHEVRWPIRVEIAELSMERIDDIEDDEFLPIDASVTFDEATRRVCVEGNCFELPVDSIQLDFCREMFTHRVGEAVSWDIISDRMEDTNPSDHHRSIESLQESVRNAYRVINQKAQEIGIRQLFGKKKKSYIKLQ